MVHAGNRPPAAGASPPIVVGVDGSPGCRPALEYALDEADRRSTRVVVATGALPPGWVADPPFASEGDVAALLTAVRDGTHAFITRTIAERRRAGLPVAPTELRPRADCAVASLLATAEEVGAALIVVGRRPGTPAVGGPPCSVGDRLIRQSRCPVTVVPSHVACSAQVGAGGRTAVPVRRRRPADGVGSTDARVGVRPALAPSPGRWSSRPAGR